MTYGPAPTPPGAPFEQNLFLDWEAGTMPAIVWRLSDEQRNDVRKYLRDNVSRDVLAYFSPDPERMEKIETAIRAAFEQGKVTRSRLAEYKIPEPITPDYIRAVYDDTLGLGPLEALLRDPSVTSLTAVAWDTLIVERGKDREQGREKFRNREHLIQCAKNLAIACGQSVSDVSPRMTHFQRTPPARIHVDISSTTGACICFRRGRVTAWGVSELVRRRAMSAEVAELLVRLVRAEVSLVIIGPPGAGKTTVLEALIRDLPLRHLVVVEDGVDELHPEHPWLTHIVVTPIANLDTRGTGQTGGDMAEAGKSALRKNTDQVIYGETTDGNAGHIISNAPSYLFSATTLHGDTIQAGLARFARLAQLPNTTPRSPYVGLPDSVVRADIALGFRAAVLVGRLADGRQVVREIAWIDGVDATDPTTPFRLTRLAWIEELEHESGIDAAWHLNLDFRLPPYYAIKLRTAELAAARQIATRGLLSGDTYKRAIAAVQNSDWASAATLLLDALHTARGQGTLAAQNLPVDVTDMLKVVLDRAGLWNAILKQAGPVAECLRRLRADRNWDVLDQTLATLDSDVTLSLAVGEQCDLREMRQALRAGRELDAEIAERISAARRQADAGRVKEGLQLLLTPQADLLPKHYQMLHDEASRLFVKLAGIPYSQMAALRDGMAVLQRLSGHTVTMAEQRESVLDLLRRDTVETAKEIVTLTGQAYARTQSA